MSPRSCARPFAGAATGRKAAYAFCVLALVSTLTACSNDGLPPEQAKAKIQQAAEAGDVGALKDLAYDPADAPQAQAIADLGRVAGFVPAEERSWDAGYDVVFVSTCPDGARVSTRVRFLNVEWYPKPTFWNLKEPVGSCPADAASSSDRRG